MHEALREVPDDFAAPVELHDIDGFKYHEIADILGIPIGTVMSRISRGRRLLAGAMVARHGLREHARPQAAVQGADLRRTAVRARPTTRGDA